MDDNRDVELRFPPVAEHVRTARLVAVAVARRAGLDDLRLDEVRLAVGEACARAVRRCRRSGTPGPVIMVVSDMLTDITPGLRVEVWDDATPTREGRIPGADIEDDESPLPTEIATEGEGALGEAADDVLDEGEVIALLTGLADRVDVMDGTAGPEGRVRMVWVHRPQRRTRRRTTV